MAVVPRRTKIVATIGPASSAPDVLESLMHALRRIAAAGSRLAISLSVTSSSTAETVRRAAFRTAVAAMGEPARTVLDRDEVDGLLAATGWAMTGPQSERARHAGLLVLEPSGGDD